MATTQTVRSSKHFFDAVKQLKLTTNPATQVGQVEPAHPIASFQFRLSRRSSVLLKLSKLAAELQVKLLNSSGEVVEQSSFNRATGRDTYKFLPSGTYYLQVVRQGRSTKYHLALAVQHQLAGSASAGHSPTVTSRSDRLIRQVLALTNSYRQQAGLAPLQLNPALTTAAYTHSLDMATHDFFGHVGFNGSTLFNRLDAAGYSYTSAGENIAAGFTTARTVVQAWMNSPLHRQNILTPFVEDIGIGFVFLPRDAGTLKMRYYWTQDFGVPKA